jgi:hypothetical protein
MIREEAVEERVEELVDLRLVSRFLVGPVLEPAARAGRLHRPANHPLASFDEA